VRNIEPIKTICSSCR